jgi:hemerythrin-like metal-binding protein
MSHLSVPYGSSQLPDGQGCAFALPWVAQLDEQGRELDLEHEALLQKLNSLLIALNSGDATRITMACNVMSVAAQAHFANEEELMLAEGYPDRAAHIEQHEELMRSLARIEFSLASGSGFWSPTYPLSMLERWFVPHLSYADRRFADFMADRRAVPHDH